MSWISVHYTVLVKARALSWRECITRRIYNKKKITNKSSRILKTKKNSFGVVGPFIFLFFFCLIIIVVKVISYSTQNFNCTRQDNTDHASIEFEM
jgi:hypothetical protein